MWINNYWCCSNWFNRKGNLCNNIKGKGGWSLRDTSWWIKIHKYAMDNRNTAAVYKFKARFPRLNESTGREFKKKKKRTEKCRNWSQSIYSGTGRPLLQDDLDSMVQTCIKQLSNRGVVVNRATPNTTAQALLITNLGLLVKSMCAFLSGLRAYFVEWVSKRVEKLRWQ